MPICKTKLDSNTQFVLLSFNDDLTPIYRTFDPEAKFKDILPVFEAEIASAMEDITEDELNDELGVGIELSLYSLENGKSKWRIFEAAFSSKNANDLRMLKRIYTDMRCAVAFSKADMNYYNKGWYDSKDGEADTSNFEAMD